MEGGVGCCGSRIGFGGWGWIWVDLCLKLLGYKRGGVSVCMWVWVCVKESVLGMLYYRFGNIHSEICICRFACMIFCKCIYSESVYIKLRVKNESVYVCDICGVLVHCLCVEVVVI